VHNFNLPDINFQSLNKVVLNSLKHSNDIAVPSPEIRHLYNNNPLD